MHASRALCLSSMLFCAACGESASYSQFNPQPAPPPPQACTYLKAAQFAYDVNAPGAVTSTQPTAIFDHEQGEAWGVVNKSMPGDPQNRDSAYLWLSKSKLVIVFRGTLLLNKPTASAAPLPLVADDWANDAKFLAVSDPELGRVHQGFRDSLQALWGPKQNPPVDSIQYRLDQWKSEGKLPPGLPVYITGHSKGGALADMAALKLKVEGILPVTAVYTYAGARAGTADFAQRYAGQKLDGITYRYENQFDLVPHLPFSKQDLDARLPSQLQKLSTQQLGQGQDDYYVSVGNLHYIFSSSDDDHNLEALSLGYADQTAQGSLDVASWDDLWSHILVLNHGDFAKTLFYAHELYPWATSRYYLGVCGAGSTL